MASRATDVDEIDRLPARNRPPKVLGILRFFGKSSFKLLNGGRLFAICVGRLSTSMASSEVSDFVAGGGGVFDSAGFSNEAGTLVCVLGFTEVMKNDDKLVIELLAEIIGVLADERPITGDAGNVKALVGELGLLFFKRCFT